MQVGSASRLGKGRRGTTTGWSRTPRKGRRSRVTHQMLQHNITVSLTTIGHLCLSLCSLITSSWGVNPRTTISTSRLSQRTSSITWETELSERVWWSGALRLKTLPSTTPTPTWHSSNKHRRCYSLSIMWTRNWRASSTLISSAGDRTCKRPTRTIRDSSPMIISRPTTPSHSIRGISSSICTRLATIARIKSIWVSPCLTGKSTLTCINQSLRGSYSTVLSRPSLRWLRPWITARHRKTRWCHH
jgi:hypothetical protein